MKDVSPIALFDGAPIVLGEIVRPAQAEPVDHIAAFEYGDHQPDGSVRDQSQNFLELIAAIQAAASRTGLSDWFVCLSICEQVGVGFDASFPPHLYREAASLANKLAASPSPLF